MRQYAGNRVGLAVVGAILLALGGYAWLRGQDRFFDLPPGAKVLPAAARKTLAEEPWPLWFVAFAPAVPDPAGAALAAAQPRLGPPRHPQRHRHRDAVRRAQGRGRARQGRGPGGRRRPAHRPDPARPPPTWARS
ncbi:hypothetical protein [Nonomuraea salmonea]|uniref:hypothetical protein n=1 Tax=Nonomuraea salmonea TaxID=46181 RepID=UPI0031E92EE3